jgi:hypothetical protein
VIDMGSSVRGSTIPAYDRGSVGRTLRTKL